MLEWYVSLFPNSAQGAADAVTVALLILLGLGFAVAIAGYALASRSSKRERKRAQKLQSYIRAYDKHGNRIK